MSHPIVHIELSAENREEAKKFYTAVFGWGMQDFPEMNYTTFSTPVPESPLGGGLNPVQEDYPAGTVLVYIHTDDIEKTLAAVEANGGKTVAPSTEIPGVGWFAIFTDPTGNQLGLLKPAPGQG